MFIQQVFGSAIATIKQWAYEHQHTLLVIGFGMAIGAALAPILVPALAAAMGFGAVGVASGSIAALIHAIIGDVAAGSLFAALQTIGATGAIGLWSFLTSMGVGAALGKAIDFIAPHILRLAQTAMLSGGDLAKHLAVHLAGALALIRGRLLDEALLQALAERIQKD